jgi:Set1/Ash2 histone methyltransferase complex subunit ASH2
VDAELEKLFNIVPICSIQVTVSDDRLSVSGHKFYCNIRANLYVNRGSWFFEAKINDLPEGAATRIGWGQKHANLQVIGHPNL